MSSSTAIPHGVEDSNDANNLRDLLTSFWQLDINERRRAREEVAQMKWTVSSLTKLYLRDLIDSYHSTNGSLGNGQDEHCNVASLASVAASKINDLLTTSDNIEADISTITNSLSSTTLRQIFKDGKTPYRILRAFLDMPMNLELDKPVESGARKPKVTPSSVQDIDEAVLLNERYIRSRPSPNNQDDKYLVTLDDLATILGKPQLDTSPSWAFRRKDPPRGGYEFLNEKRKRTIEIVSDMGSYSTTFARITDNILNGLDWNNVFVAGGTALTTLLRVDRIEDEDLDIYIYGLDVERANQKVEEIYQVWKSNLPVTSQQLVVKNAKTIQFISYNPNRRIRIILKLLMSPTQVLLDFDLDAFAIGFDGKRVLMLPRCARAIETGYSVFTMDLIWGHCLSHERVTREKRIFEHADRGFGLRILPCYVKSLEVVAGREIGGDLYPEAGINDISGDKEGSDGSLNSSFPAPRLLYHSRDDYRMPQGPEPGLKTLKRVACLGQDFTNRFCWDNTPLHHPKDGSLSREGWIEDYQARKKLTQTRIEEFRRPLYVAKRVRPYSLAKLDYCWSPVDMPDASGSLGSFEKFVRHVEAWTLNASPGPKLFDLKPFISTISYDGVYNTAPEFERNWDYTPRSLAHWMDDDSSYVFEVLKNAISEKLHMPYQSTGYSGYLTRRIRRQVHGPDLKAVMEKQITIPLVIPYDLEHFLREEMPNTCSDIPPHYLSKAFLIPVHDPAAQDPANPGIIPPLHDIVSEAGNLRYWVITNESMWVCQHRAMDEIFEILSSLSHWFVRPVATPASVSCAQPEAVWHMARSLRCRAVSPKISSFPASGAKRPKDSAGKNTTSGLTSREVMLFRPWVLAEPFYRDRQSVEEPGADFSRPGFEEDAYLYPVPDELFWKEGDEGEWDSEEVPQWRDFPEEEEKSKAPANRKRKMEDTDEQEVLVVEDD